MVVGTGYEVGLRHKRHTAPPLSFSAVTAPALALSVHEAWLRESQRPCVPVATAATVGFACAELVLVASGDDPWPPLVSELCDISFLSI